MGDMARLGAGAARYGRRGFGFGFRGFDALHDGVEGPLSGARRGKGLGEAIAIEEGGDVVVEGGKVVAHGRLPWALSRRIAAAKSWRAARSRV